MTLDFINTLSATVSAIAVVLSLVFVGLQLRASTRAQRALAAWQSENAWAQLNFEVSIDPRTAELLQTILSEDASLADLAGAKLPQARFMVRSLLQHVQSQYFLFREGSLSVEDWRHQKIWVVKFARLPLVVAFLNEVVDQGILSSDFWAEVISPASVREATR